MYSYGFQGSEVHSSSKKSPNLATNIWDRIQQILIAGKRLGYFPFSRFILITSSG